MRPVILDIVHPEYYFGSPEDHIEEEYLRQHHRNAVGCLKQLVDTMIRNGKKIFRYRDMPEPTSFIVVKMLQASMDINLETRGLAAIIEDEEKYERCKIMHMHRCGMPLKNDVYDTPEWPTIARLYSPLLTERTFDEAYGGLETAVHYIAGGLFGNCVTNWGEYLRKRHPDSSIVYINEACIDWSKEGRERALRRASEQHARVVCIDEALAEINEQSAPVQQAL